MLKAFLHWTTVIPFVIWPAFCGYTQLDPVFSFLGGIVVGYFWMAFRLASL